MPFQADRRFLRNHDDFDRASVDTPVEGATHGLVIHPDYDPEADEPGPKYADGALPTGGPGGESVGASGTAVIEHPETSVAVPHGVGDDPEPVDFQVTPTNDLGDAAKFWIDDVDVDDLTIAVDQAPGMGNTAEFVWRFLRVAPTEPVLLFSEDFEDGTAGALVSQSGGTWTVHGDFARDSDFGLQGAAGAAFHVRYTADPFAVADGFFYRGWVRAVSGSPIIAGLHFAGQASGVQGYQALIDPRNGSGSQAAFQLRRDASSSVLASDSGPTITVGDWYRIDVEWSFAFIQARLYDDSDTHIGTVNAADANYAAGRVGVIGFQTSQFDDLALYDRDPDA